MNGASPSCIPLVYSFIWLQYSVNLNIQWITYIIKKDKLITLKWNSIYVVMFHSLFRIFSASKWCIQIEILFLTSKKCIFALCHYRSWSKNLWYLKSNTNQRKEMVITLKWNSIYVVMFYIFFRIFSASKWCINLEKFFWKSNFVFINK